MDSERREPANVPHVRLAPLYSPQALSSPLPRAHRPTPPPSSSPGASLAQGRVLPPHSPLTVWAAGPPAPSRVEAPCRSGEHPEAQRPPKLLTLPFVRGLLAPVGPASCHLWLPLPHVAPCPHGLCPREAMGRVRQPGLW